MANNETELLLRLLDQRVQGLDTAINTVWLLSQGIGSFMEDFVAITI
jgi:hypothetical protein